MTIPGCAVARAPDKKLEGLLTVARVDDFIPLMFEQPSQVRALGSIIFDDEDWTQRFRKRMVPIHAA